MCVINGDLQLVTRQEIYKNYIWSTSFWLDVLASFPMELFAILSGFQIQIICDLRLNRLLHVISCSRFLDVYNLFGLDIDKLSSLPGTSCFLWLSFSLTLFERSHVLINSSYRHNLSEPCLGGHAWQARVTTVIMFLSAVALLQ